MGYGDGNCNSDPRHLAMKEFRNTGVLQRVRDASRRSPAEPCSVKPMLKHPHRALEPGKQYVAHTGAKARARYLKQMQRNKQATLQQEYGSTAVRDREPDGALILDFGE